MPRRLATVYHKVVPLCSRPLGVVGVGGGAEWDCATPYGGPPDLLTVYDLTTASDRFSRDAAESVDTYKRVLEQLTPLRTRLIGFMRERLAWARERERERRGAGARATEQVGAQYTTPPTALHDHATEPAHGASVSSCAFDEPFVTLLLNLAREVPLAIAALHRSADALEAACVVPPRQGDLFLPSVEIGAFADDVRRRHDA